MSDKLSFKIRDTQLPKTSTCFWYRGTTACSITKMFSVSINSLRERIVVRCFVVPFTGKNYWRFENEEERTAAIYYNSDNEPTGVLLLGRRRSLPCQRDVLFGTKRRVTDCGTSSLHIFSMVYWVHGDI